MGGLTILDRRKAARAVKNARGSADSRQTLTNHEFPISEIGNRFQAAHDKGAPARERRLATCMRGAATDEAQTLHESYSI
jgi:hypothetical protein